MRFGLLAMSSSQDVRFSEEKIAQGQALVNKLFNATRFALLQIGDEDIAPEPRVGGDGLVEDRWILSRLDAAKDAMRTRIDDFDFAKAALGLYDYIYGDLCDWYLEMVKPRLYAEDDPGGRADLAATLRHVLRETLMLAHPIIPFVTEELWGMLGEDGLLAATLAPAAGGSARDPEAEEQVGRAIAAVTALRGWRDRCEVRPGAIVPDPAARGGLRGDRRDDRRTRTRRAGRERDRAGRRHRRPRRDDRRAPEPRRRPRRRRAPPRGPSCGAARRRSSAPSASSPTRASWPRRRRRWWTPSATSSLASGQSSRSCRT